jgi:hypothetical protein
MTGFSMTTWLMRIERASVRGKWSSVNFLKKVEILKAASSADHPFAWFPPSSNFGAAGVCFAVE